MYWHFCAKFGQNEHMGVFRKISRGQQSPVLEGFYLGVQL